jgi:hypothetical protein
VAVGREVVRRSILGERPAVEEFVLENLPGWIEAGGGDMLEHPTRRFREVAFSDVGASFVALVGREGGPVVGHFSCQPRDVGTARFVVAADGVDPHEGAARRKNAVAIFDDVDLSFRREVMDRVAAEDDVGRVV